MHQNIIHRIRKKIVKLRLQPIRVFCFHQVSDAFDPSTMWECDWTQIEQFKCNIICLKEKYKFIPLAEAYTKLQHDIFRQEKYAVLTADDGWASLKNIIPWLVEQEIPVTLFVNSTYLDGKHYQERETEKLLTKEDLKELVERYPQCITIASHGETHINTQELSVNAFKENVERAERVLAELPNKIHFYAFTYGKYNNEFLSILEKNNLVPILLDGEKNYNAPYAIHREILDGAKL